MNFMRIGTSGQWKTELTDEMKAKVDEWEAKALKGSDFDLYGPRNTN